MTQKNLLPDLKKLDRKALERMAKDVRDLERRLSTDGPQNDDELHKWILNNLKINIPRVAVCEGHIAPFQFIADLYFERTSAAILMANRGGSKTYGVAIVHLLNCYYKPGFEAASVGAIEVQGDRCYDHFRRLLTLFGGDGVKNSVRKKTEFVNLSQLEILMGTKAGVNGPHPQFVHVDEVELMEEEVYQESRSMSTSKTLPNGRIYRAQDVITSTRKRIGGMMQKLLDAIDEAKLSGATPPYDLYVWCIFETAEEVKNCCVANPDLPQEQQCGCDKIVSGRWEDGSLRTLKSVCGGKFAKSRGWITLDTIQSTFTKANKDMWEAQHECKKPSKKGLVFPGFSRERHCIRNYKPYPEYGPIFMGVDFGGTNPHSVHWYQVLSQELEVEVYNSFIGEAPKTRRLREGTRVCFGELYIAEIGNGELADLILLKEEEYKTEYPGWKVYERYADPAGKAARLDLKHHRPPIITSFKCTREKEEHIKVCNGLIENDLFVVDANTCEYFIAEIEWWPYKDKRGNLHDNPEEPVDEFNHAMSDFRYTMANIHHLELTGINKLSDIPKFFTKKTSIISNRNIPISNSSLPASERWRLKLGGMPGGRRV